MCKDNRGMSLVELVIVLAIMAVMIGGSIFSISMLTGAQARQGAKNMEAQLNDIKTGAMSRASEYMVVRYIDVPSGSEKAYAEKGISKSGFYAQKYIKTIDNASTIVVDISSSGDSEFTYLAAKKVAIGINDNAIILDSDHLTNSFLVEYNRGDGTLKKVQLGSVSDNKDTASFSKSSEVVLDKMTFKSGLKTYTITFDSATGKHSYN